MTAPGAASGRAARWGVRIAAGVFGVAFASAIWTGTASADTGLLNTVSSTTKAVTTSVAPNGPKAASQPRRVVRTAAHTASQPRRIARAAAHTTPAKTPQAIRPQRVAQPVTSRVVSTVRRSAPVVPQPVHRPAVRQAVSRPAPQHVVAKHVVAKHPATKAPAAKHPVAEVVSSVKKSPAVDRNAARAPVQTVLRATAAPSTVLAPLVRHLDPVTTPALTLVSGALASSVPLLAELPLVGGPLDRLLPVATDVVDQVTHPLPVVGRGLVPTRPVAHPTPAQTLPTELGASSTAAAAQASATHVRHDATKAASTPTAPADRLLVSPAATSRSNVAAPRQPADGSLLPAAVGLGRGVTGTLAAAAATASVGAVGWAGLAVLATGLLLVLLTSSGARPECRPATSRLLRQPGFAPD